MPYKVLLKKVGDKQVKLNVDEGGTVTFDSNSDLIFHNLDAVDSMLRSVVSAMKANEFVKVEVEVE